MALFWWRKSEAATGGKLVATVAWAETPDAEPTPTGGQVVAHGQRMVHADSRGKTIEPRDGAGAIVAGTADENASTPINVDLARVGAYFQNVGEEFVIWWAFGDTAAVGQSFKLFPGQLLPLSGDLCRDSITVVTAAGEESDFVFQPW